MYLDARLIAGQHQQQQQSHDDDGGGRDCRAALPVDSSTNETRTVPAMIFDMKWCARWRTGHTHRHSGSCDGIYGVSDAMRRAGHQHRCSRICDEKFYDFGLPGVVPGMVVVVTVVRESGHSTTEPDNGCTGM